MVVIQLALFFLMTLQVIHSIILSIPHEFIHVPIIHVPIILHEQYHDVIHDDVCEHAYLQMNSF